MCQLLHTSTQQHAFLVSFLTCVSPWPGLPCNPAVHSPCKDNTTYHARMQNLLGLQASMTGVVLFGTCQILYMAAPKAVAKAASKGCLMSNQ